jgi:hypothetical protein
MPPAPHRELDRPRARGYFLRYERGSALAVCLPLCPLVFLPWLLTGNVAPVVCGVVVGVLVAWMLWRGLGRAAEQDCDCLALTHRWGALGRGHVVGKRWRRPLGHPFLLIRAPALERPIDTARCFCLPPQWEQVALGDEVAFLTWEGYANRHSAFGSCLPVVAGEPGPDGTGEAGAEEALRTRIGLCLARMQAGFDSSRYAGRLLGLVLAPVAVVVALLAAVAAFPNVEWLCAVIFLAAACAGVRLSPRVYPWLRRRTLVRDALTDILQLDGDDLRVAHRMLSEDPDPREACTRALAYLDRRAQLASAPPPVGPQDTRGPGTAATAS